MVWLLQQCPGRAILSIVAITTWFGDDAEVCGIPTSTVWVQDHTGEYPIAGFSYGEIGGDLKLVRFELSHDEFGDPRPTVVPFTPRTMRNMPISSWEMTARVTLLRHLKPAESAIPDSAPDRDTFLRAIADEYRLAISQGSRSPAKQIADAHGVNPGTARAWVYRARLAGLLGKADGTRAGEAGVDQPSSPSPRGRSIRMGSPKSPRKQGKTDG